MAEQKPARCVQEMRCSQFLYLVYKWRMEMLVSQRRQNVPFSLYSPFFPQNTGRKCLEGERIVVVKKVIRQEQGTEFSTEDPTKLFEVIQT